MEVSTRTENCVPQAPTTFDNDYLQTACNWTITNNKRFRETFTTAPSLQAFEKTKFEDVVSFSTCISLQPPPGTDESCMLDIKVTNGQRISRITVVSEACVLEFFKQFGEYEGTVFADFVDKFEDSHVYFAETEISPPASEASIKFAKRESKDPLMWIYGIRLYLTEPIKEKDSGVDIFDLKQIQSLLTKKFDIKINENITNSHAETQRIETVRSESNRETNQNGIYRNYGPVLAEISKYIDNKLLDMETRLLKRVDEMEERTNNKLDAIIKKLGSEM